MRDEFLSEEDLDFGNLPWEERLRWWQLWLEAAQATNDADVATYSHGVFREDPAPVSFAELRARERARRAAS